MQKNNELNTLIEKEKKIIKVHALTCGCFAFIAGGQLTISMFNPEISNFMMTGGFAVFSGANAYWMAKHYAKKNEYEEKKQIKTK